jgi:hypothetical protein
MELSTHSPFRGKYIATVVDLIIHLGLWTVRPKEAANLD